jgi:predicted Zn-dependent peptidase
VTYDETRTSDGLRVVTESIPSVRSVALGMWVGVGSRDERDHEHGCSHFLEHLLFKGTSRRTARQIAEELDAVGGEMNAFTSKEVTCFYARVLDRDLELAVDVLSDMLVGATNHAEDVEAEREVVRSEIAIHIDSPDDLAQSDFAETVLGDHPLAREILGTDAGIGAMDRETIHGYYRHHYRPGNLVVAAAGNLDHAAVAALAGDHLGDLGRPGGDTTERAAPVPASPGTPHVRSRPTEQAHVVLGGAGVSHGDGRRHPLRVLNVLLGGGMSSRLFQEIRERRGLAYSIYSFATSYTDVGVYGAYAGTTPAKVDEVLGLVRAELDGIADTVTDEEVERAKGTLRGGIVLGLEDPGSRMSRIGKLTSLGLDLESVDEAIAHVDAVTLDDVREVARDIVAQPRHLSVVGPFDEDPDRFVEHVAT